jgi:hypothetical protein
MSTDRIQLDFSNGPDVSTTLVHLRDGCSDGCSVIRLLADQIERQTKPPRIPEPGLWGVVTAGDLTRDYWIHYRANGEEQWFSTDSGVTSTWDDLIDPTLVRSGIEERS